MLSRFSQFQYPEVSRGSGKSMGVCPILNSFHSGVFHHQTFVETGEFQNKDKLTLFGHFSEFCLAPGSETSCSL